MSSNVPTKDALELMVTLMEASHDASTHVTNQLIAGIEADRQRLQAQVLLIQHRVADLLNDRFAPSANALIEAIHPTRAEVDAMLEYCIEQGVIIPLGI